MSRHVHLSEGDREILCAGKVQIIEDDLGRLSVYGCTWAGDPHASAKDLSFFLREGSSWSRGFNTFWPPTRPGEMLHLTAEVPVRSPPVAKVLAEGPQPTYEVYTTAVVWPRGLFWGPVTVVVSHPHPLYGTMRRALTQDWVDHQNEPGDRSDYRQAILRIAVCHLLRPSVGASSRSWVLPPGSWVPQHVDPLAGETLQAMADVPPCAENPVAADPFEPEGWRTLDPMPTCSEVPRG